MEERLSQLENRLSSAEAEVRRLRRNGRGLGVMALAVLVGGAVLMTSAPAETQLGFDRRLGGTRIRGPLTVLSRQGKPVMQVTGGSNGGVLALFDREGRPSLLAGGSPEGNGIRLMDSEGRKVCDLGHSPKGEQRGLQIYDTAGQPVGGLGLSPLGRGLAVNDSAGRVLARLGEDDSDAASRGLGLFNDDGQLVGGLLGKHAHGELVLGEPDGTVLFTAP